MICFSLGDMAYSEWGIKAVAKWLTTIGLKEVAPKFIGECLLYTIGVSGS